MLGHAVRKEASTSMVPFESFTPHASSLSRESIVELRRETAHNVVVALEGGIPRSTLNRRELGLSSSPAAVKPKSRRSSGSRPPA